MWAIGDFPPEGDKGKEFFSFVEGGWGLEKWGRSERAGRIVVYLIDTDVFRRHSGAFPPSGCAGNCRANPYRDGEGCLFGWRLGQLRDGSVETL